MDDQRARNRYLESQVMTAPPQKLRLMLIDGAIRFGRQVVEAWNAGQYEEGLPKLTRCRGIVSELLSSIKVDEDQLARSVTRIYLFLYRELTEAQLSRDVSIVEGVLRVLEVERETWQQVCEQLAQFPDGLPTTSGHQEQASAPVVAPADSLLGQGFQLEA